MPIIEQANPNQLPGIVELLEEQGRRAQYTPTSLKSRQNLCIRYIEAYQYKEVQL